MKKIKRVVPKSLAKIFGFIYAFLGLIGGAVFFLTSLAGVAMGGRVGSGSLLFGIGALIFIPLIYGLLGFVMSYITALIYNFAASKTGGIEVEVE